MIIIGCQFLLTGGSMLPRYVCNFYLVKNCIIAKNSATTKAKEKISTYFESLDILMYVGINLKTIKFYLIKLATDFD
jgi:hypothetical protein